MSFLHNIPVLAVDSQEINTRGADTRQRNLTRTWTALENRAKQRKEGHTPPTRKQKLKLRTKKKETKIEKENGTQKATKILNNK